VANGIFPKKKEISSVFDFKAKLSVVMLAKFTHEVIFIIYSVFCLKIGGMLWFSK
jgi:hypothetical protein